MRRIFCGFVLALACPGFAQMASVPDRVAQQNALFEEFYQAGLKNSPERATSFGDYRYNALLAQYSLAEIARQHAEADEFLKRLQAIRRRRKDKRISQASARPLTAIPSGNRKASSRLWMFLQSTSTRWNQSCRSCSGYYRRRRLRWSRSRISPRRSRRTMSRARRWEAARACGGGR